MAELLPPTNGNSNGEGSNGNADGPSAVPAPAPRRTTAEAMAKKQREISVSEFFAKNRHLLGFDNPRKALLTCVKEAVDNALDACEEAGILPSIYVKLIQLAEDRFRVLVRDNGPGIVEKNIKNVFGKLLYGSKFHRLRMSRGQQGIGISAAGMYGLMTTGKHVCIVSRTSPKKPAHYCELQIDTKRNEAEIIKSHDCDDTEMRKILHLSDQEAFEHGTQVEIELKAAYLKGRQSVDAYVEQTAIANPHAEFVYVAPGAEPERFPRATHELPPEPKEIKPHPYGIELGTLIKMLKESPNRYLTGFLKESFCRVTDEVAHEICKHANLKPSCDPTEMGHKEVEQLFHAIQKTKIMAPPTDCLAPIGTKAILAGLLKEIKADFYTAVERKPSVYRGNPFLIEVGLAFGGELGQFVGKDDIQLIDSDIEDKTRRKKKSEEQASGQARLIRFANRVPLLYQQGACCTFKSVIETKWGNYGVPQRRGNLPDAPLIVMIHLASVWVPFTSESKEAIADYDEIRKEIKLGLQEAGRKLSAYINRRNRMRREGERRSIFLRYIPEVVASAKRLDPDVDPDQLKAGLLALAKVKTEAADTVLDDEGQVVKAEEEEGTLADTIIVRDADGTETAHAEVADKLRNGDLAGAEALRAPPQAAAASEVPVPPKDTPPASAANPASAPSGSLPTTGRAQATGQAGGKHAAMLFENAA